MFQVVNLGLVLNGLFFMCCRYGVNVLYLWYYFGTRSLASIKSTNS